MQLIRNKRHILKYKYDRASPEQQWAVSLWKSEYKRLLPLLRKFERLDPLNYGYNERWKFKRLSKEERREARLRMAEDIAKMRDELK